MPNPPTPPAADPGPSFLQTLAQQALLYGIDLGRQGMRGAAEGLLGMPAHLPMPHAQEQQMQQGVQQQRQNLQHFFGDPATVAGQAAQPIGNLLSFLASGLLSGAVEKYYANSQGYHFPVRDPFDGQVFMAPAKQPSGPGLDKRPMELENALQRDVDEIFRHLGDLSGINEGQASFLKNPSSKPVDPKDMAQMRKKLSKVDSPTSNAYLQAHALAFLIDAIQDPQGALERLRARLSEGLPGKHDSASSKPQPSK